jgi:ribonuclease Z
MKRRLGVAAVLLAIIIGLAAVFGRGWLGEQAFHRALDQNAGIDQSAKLGDGLHAYMCGTGSPMPDAERAGPCIAVLAGSQAFVFDSGSGAIRKLGRMGFPMDRIEGMFLTHLHSDHIDGLGELMLQAWIAGGRSQPLPIYGPPGTEQVVEGFNHAYQIDSGYRLAHHGPVIANPAGYGGEAIESPLPEDAVSQIAYDQQGVKITVFRVDHAPIDPAFGYRVDYKGRSLVISGDTVYSPDLVRTARGADVLFHEAMSMEMVAALGQKLGQRGQANTAQIMSDIQNYHASPGDAVRAAKEAGVSTLVLYHLVPPLPSAIVEPMFLGDAPRQFSGTLKVGQDGMIVSLPAGSKAVKFSQVF